MKELITQFTGQILEPQSPEDLKTLQGEYKRNQLVRIKTYAIGAQWEPSLEQSNLMHACFKLVADSTDNPRLQTKEQVKFACKVALHFVYEDRIAVQPNGMITFEYRSFGFKELKRMERLNIVQRAFEWMADILGITVDELVAEAKSRMKRVST